MLVFDSFASVKTGREVLQIFQRWKYKLLFPLSPLFDSAAPLSKFKSAPGHGEITIGCNLYVYYCFPKKLRLPSLRPILSKNGMRLFPKLNQQDIHCHLKK